MIKLARAFSPGCYTPVRLIETFQKPYRYLGSWFRLQNVS
jgi:hypothetical protein